MTDNHWFARLLKISAPFFFVLKETSIEKGIRTYCFDRKRALIPEVLKKQLSPFIVGKDKRAFGFVKDRWSALS